MKRIRKFNQGSSSLTSLYWQNLQQNTQSSLHKSLEKQYYRFINSSHVQQDLKILGQTNNKYNNKSFSYQYIFTKINNFNYVQSSNQQIKPSFLRHISTNIFYLQESGENQQDAKSKGKAKKRSSLFGTTYYMIQWALLLSIAVPLGWIGFNYFFGDTIPEKYRSTINNLVRSEVEGLQKLYNIVYGTLRKYQDTGKIEFVEEKVVVKPLNKDLQNEQKDNFKQKDKDLQQKPKNISQNSDQPRQSKYLPNSETVSQLQDKVQIGVAQVGEVVNESLKQQGDSKQEKGLKQGQKVIPDSQRITKSASQTVDKVQDIVSTVSSSVSNMFSQEQESKKQQNKGSIEGERQKQALPPSSVVLEDSQLSKLAEKAFGLSSSIDLKGQQQALQQETKVCEPGEQINEQVDQYITKPTSQLKEKVSSNFNASSSKTQDTFQEYVVEPSKQGIQAFTQVDSQQKQNNQEQQDKIQQEKKNEEQQDKSYQEYESSIQQQVSEYATNPEKTLQKILDNTTSTDQSIEPSQYQDQVQLQKEVEQIRRDLEEEKRKEIEEHKKELEQLYEQRVSQVQNNKNKELFKLQCNLSALEIAIKKQQDLLSKKSDLPPLLALLVQLQQKINGGQPFYNLAQDIEKTLQNDDELLKISLQQLKDNPAAKQGLSSQADLYSQWKSVQFNIQQSQYLPTGTSGIFSGWLAYFTALFKIQERIAVSAKDPNIALSIDQQLLLAENYIVLGQWNNAQNILKEVVESRPHQVNVQKWLNTLYQRSQIELTMELIKARTQIIWQQTY